MTFDRLCIEPKNLKECDDIECFECAFEHFRINPLQPIDKDCYFRILLINQERRNK